MKIKRQSIRAKLNIVVLTVALLSILLLGVIALTALFRMRATTININAGMGQQAASDSRQMLEDQAMDQLKSIAALKAETIDAQLQTIMSQIDVLAAAAEELYATPERFSAIPVSPADASTQGTYTAQIVYAERTTPQQVAGEVGLLGNLTIPMKKATEYLSGAGTTQIGTESGFIIMCDENAGLKVDLGHLEPTERSWYRMAADSGEMTWSDVFVDSYGRGLAVTCGKPVYGPDGQLRAVLSIGSTLDDISSSVVNTSIGETGYVFVVDHSGDVIMSKNIELDAAGHVTNNENLLESQEPSIQAAAQQMISGGQGVIEANYQGRAVYLAYEPMHTVPWTVVTVIDVEEVLSPSVAGEQRIQALTQEAGADIDQFIRLACLLFLAAVLIATIIAIVLGNTFSLRLSKPIRELETGVENISGGDLDYQLNIHTGDEIESLAGAFNTMTTRLQTYIQDLTAVTAEKERIGAELGVATQIQASMLPCIFPAFPGRPEFDIFADMHPAKEVGGDFYDFFMTDDDHLWVVMADVSGKGVPAALFMVIAKTLLKNHAGFQASPAEVLETVNNQLCESNDAGMFVTTFIGRLEISTGQFVFANAGHNFPLVRRQGGDFDWLKTKPNFILAGMEDIHYQNHEITLSAGDRLFLYTDGVTEALNPAQALYSDDRLIQTLNQPEVRTMGIEALISYMKEDIHTFADGAAQADDITMLVLEVK